MKRIKISCNNRYKRLVCSNNPEYGPLLIILKYIPYRHLLIELCLVCKAFFRCSNIALKDRNAIISKEEIRRLILQKRYLHLLKERIIDPSALSGYAFVWAARVGQYRTVRKLLKEYKNEIDPAKGGNRAIMLASRNYHFRIVEELLKDERVYNSLRPVYVNYYVRLCKQRL